MSVLVQEARSRREERTWNIHLIVRVESPVEEYCNWNGGPSCRCMICRGTKYPYLLEQSLLLRKMFLVVENGKGSYI